MKMFTFKYHCVSQTGWFVDLNSSRANISLSNPQRVNERFERAKPRMGTPNYKVEPLPDAIGKERGKKRRPRGQNKNTENRDEERCGPGCYTKTRLIFALRRHGSSKTSVITQK